MISKENIPKIKEAISAFEDEYRHCRLCPWDCKIDRTRQAGPCGLKDQPVLAAAVVHKGEEPPISGSRGIGNLFFAGCTMHCVYCQNYQISQKWRRLNLKGTTSLKIANEIKRLYEEGVHFIGLVSPTHVLPSVLEAMVIAAEMGVSLPVVYNTSSYERVDVLRKLNGIVDVYLADLRYSDDEQARMYSKVRGYVWASTTSIREMARQVGSKLIRNEHGLAKKGLIIRILVLPNDIAGVERSLSFIKDTFGTDVTLSLMAQYTPMYRASRYLLISRKLHAGEYLRALELAEKLGFEDVFVQSLDAADYYVPDFSRDSEIFK